MLTCLDAISNGDVIAVQGRRYVVVAVDRSRCRAVPIFGASATRHRADVPLEDRLAREACGSGDRAVVIACRWDPGDGRGSNRGALTAPAARRGGAARYG